MRSWTIPAAVCGMLIALLSTAVSARPSHPVITPETTGHGQNGPPPSIRVRMIVGDTLRVALRMAPGRVIRALPGPHPLVSAATFMSSNPEAVAVVAGNILRAVAPGNATITGTPPDASHADSGSMEIEVMTARQLSNATAVEVCPNRDERLFIDQEPLTEGVPPIHEYHDCQKLIANGAYSPLVGIFAHHNVDNFQRWQEFERGRLAAIIVNFPDGNVTTPYPSLGIGPGVNCLVLRASGEQLWEGAVIPQQTALLQAGGKRYTTCRDDLTWADVISNPAATRLQVKTQRGYAMDGGRDAPPVARWDWDGTHRLNYIGVMCGARTWCEVGPQGFVPSVALTLPRGFFRRLMFWRGARPILKGYYDQQYLADSTATNPSTVFGTIQPGNDARYKGQMRHSGAKRWYNVAQLRFQETDSTPSKEYTRYVREYHGLPASGVVTALVTTSQYDLEPIYPPTDDTYGMYRGRFNKTDLMGALSGGQTGGVIAFRGHSRHAANMKAPTARWRWYENDERTWTYCEPDGCCENVATLQ